MANGNTSPLTGSDFSGGVGIINFLKENPIVTGLGLLSLLALILPPRARKYRPKKKAGSKKLRSKKRGKKRKSKQAPQSIAPKVKKSKKVKPMKGPVRRTSNVPIKPWMVKGSKAARDHMAALRKMRIIKG